VKVVSRQQPTREQIALRRAFESSPASQITQEAFDFGPKHLRRLSRLRLGDRAEVHDLFEYTQDLLYTEIQVPLLAYLLPFCLEAWREDLRGNEGYGGFVEHFYPVLANRQIFDKHLQANQTEAVRSFMRASILEEIDDQCGLKYQESRARPYRWIRALTTYGVLLPDADTLWTAWCSLNTVGQAVAAVQYFSCLMYQKDENPVFAPWTPDGGGGPPSLWEFAGHLYEHRWLEPNVLFLKRSLNFAEVSRVLSLAVEQLVGQPEHKVAAEVLADLPLCTDTVTARCSELPKLLETVQPFPTVLEWSK
jgi:hypothetical protein